MKLTEKLLKDIGACEDGIRLLKRYNLEGFDTEQLEDIIVSKTYTEHVIIDHVEWLKRNIPIKIEYNEKSQIKYVEFANGTWKMWNYYNNLVIFFKDSTGFFERYDYDKHNNCIYTYKNTGDEIYNKYDKNNNLIQVSKLNKLKNIKNKVVLYDYMYEDNILIETINHKEKFKIKYYYNDNKQVIRNEKYDFLLDEIPYDVNEYEYDNNGNLIFENKPLGGGWQIFKYNDNNDIIFCETEHLYSEVYEYNDFYNSITFYYKGEIINKYEYYFYDDTKQLKQITDDGKNVIKIPKIKVDL